MTSGLWGGWVEWPMGERIDGQDCHGIPLAGADHWDISVVVAMVASGPKPVGSTEGMIRTQHTSPFFSAWVDAAARDLAEGRAAILARDLDALGTVMERSTLRMHATMLSAEPPICYWTPATLAAMKRVEQLRREGLHAWYTMDAGPNVKVLCRRAHADRIAESLREVTPRVEILGVGGNASLI